MDAFQTSYDPTPHGKSDCVKENSDEEGFNDIVKEFDFSVTRSDIASFTIDS
jgi:hypothetical protein